MDQILIDLGNLLVFCAGLYAAVMMLLARRKAVIETPESSERKYPCIYCPHHGLKYVQLYGGLWYGPGHGNSCKDHPLSCDECGDTLLPAQCTESNSRAFLKGES